MSWKSFKVNTYIMFIIEHIVHNVFSLFSWNSKYNSIQVYWWNNLNFMIHSSWNLIIYILQIFIFFVKWNFHHLSHLFITCRLIREEFHYWLIIIKFFKSKLLPCITEVISTLIKSIDSKLNRSEELPW